MDVQQTVNDVQAASPYVWEIAAISSIFASLTITQWVKKRRFFPAFLCHVKQSKPKNGKVYQYFQLKDGILDAIALSLTFWGVSLCLYQRYPDMKQVMIIAGITSILQWKVVKIIFHKAKAKDTGIAAILRDGLYVPEDAPTVYKTVAYLSGGGVDKRGADEAPDDKTRVLSDEERKEITDRNHQK